MYNFSSKRRNIFAIALIYHFKKSILAFFVAQLTELAIRKGKRTNQAERQAYFFRKKP